MEGTERICPLGSELFLWSGRFDRARVRSPGPFPVATRLAPFPSSRAAGTETAAMLSTTPATISRSRPIVDPHSIMEFGRVPVSRPWAASPAMAGASPESVSISLLRCPGIGRIREHETRDAVPDGAYLVPLEGGKNSESTLVSGRTFDGALHGLPCHGRISHGLRQAGIVHLLGFDRNEVGAGDFFLPEVLALAPVLLEHEVLPDSECPLTRLGTPRCDEGGFLHGVHRARLRHEGFIGLSFLVGAKIRGPGNFDAEKADAAQGKKNGPKKRFTHTHREVTFPQPKCQNRCPPGRLKMGRGSE